MVIPVKKSFANSLGLYDLTQKPAENLPPEKLEENIEVTTIQ